MLGGRPFAAADLYKRGFAPWLLIANVMRDSLQTMQLWPGQTTLPVGLWRALSHTAGTAFADLLLNGHRKKRRQRAALEAGVIPARARLEEDPHNRNACPQARLHNELRTQLLVRE
jgi:hypothetical protein